MREGLVGLRHLVRVFALLDRAALVARRRHQLVRELLRERVVRTGARERDDPARRERVPAVRTDFHRHLVVRTADAARLHFQDRLHVVHGLLEDRHGFLAGLLLDHRHGLVEVALGDRALAAAHDRVDEPRHQDTVELGIRGRLAARDVAFTRHRVSSRPGFPGTDGARAAAPVALARAFLALWEIVTSTWCRTWTGSASGPSPRWRPACRARCGSARREGPSLGPRE